MTSELSRTWYSAGDDPPPLSIVVRVRWGARPGFEASRVVDPRPQKRGRVRETAPIAWLTHVAGRPVLLPCPDAAPPDPRAPWIGWHTLKGDGPDFWQPLTPEKWQARLPKPAFVEPLVAEPGRFWSATDRPRPADWANARLSGLTAAEMAEAMEEMRAEANAAGPAPETAAEPQWWRDPHLVTYSDPGSIAMREAEGRLMRAFIAEGAVRIERPMGVTGAQVLANMSRPGEGSDEEQRPLRLEPTGRDRDDMLVALCWLRALRKGPKGGETVLRLRGRPTSLSWARIGKALGGRSGESTRRLYRIALAEVTAAANGGPTPEVAAVRAEIAEERKRIRALGNGKALA